MGTSQELTRAEHEAEAAHVLAGAVAHPAHQSVAHVQVSALGYREAAEHALAHGETLRALYLIGIAEGIAEALRAVTGPVGGIRESAVAEMMLKRAAEIRLEVTRLYPEAGAAE